MGELCVFGDSIAKGVVFRSEQEGYGLLEQSFVGRAAEALGLSARNFSRFGCTVVKGLSAVEHHLSEAASAELTLLEFGGNDSGFDWKAVAADPEAVHMARTPIEQFIECYKKALRDILSAGGRPVAMSLPPIDPFRYFEHISRGLERENIRRWLGGRVEYIYQWHELYNNRLMRLCRAENVPVIDIRSEFLARKDCDELLCGDGIHLNERGHELAASILSREAGI